MKEHKDRLSLSAPYMKQIELVAFLQAKWTALSAEEKLSYEMMCSDDELKHSKRVEKQSEKQASKSKKSPREE